MTSLLVDSPLVADTLGDPSGIPPDAFTAAADLWERADGLGGNRKSWLDTRRDNQTPPDGDWFVWLIMAGRGFGKTRTGAEEVVEQCRTVPGSDVVVMGRTDAETRRVCMEGRSGIKGVVDLKDLEGGSWKTAYRGTPGDALLRFANGSTVRVASSSGAEAVRGLNLSLLWVDELASWRRQEDIWDEILMPAVRLGLHPRIIATTTPRPTKLIRRLFTEADTAVTKGSTWDNEANLSPKFISSMHKRYDGTRAGRQELEGELLGDVDGAVWKRSWIEDARVLDFPEAARMVDAEGVLRLRRVVVAGDPSDGTESGDEQGIAAVGLGYDHELYVFESDGLRDVEVVGFVRYLIELTAEHKGELVVEKNHGGAYLVQTIRQALRDDGRVIPWRMVVASDSKRTRAEPVAMLYEQGRVHHVGIHADLEDQMATFTGKPKEKSPDRMDALVWALSQFAEDPLALTAAEAEGPDASDVVAAATPGRLKTPPGVDAWRRHRSDDGDDDVY